MSQAIRKKSSTLLVLIVLFIAAWTQRVHISDFFQGVFEGYSRTSEQHRATPHPGN